MILLISILNDSNYFFLTHLFIFTIFRNMVGFTDECRVIGTAAEQNFSFNSANTIQSVTRYLGLKYSQISEKDLYNLTCKYSRSEDDELLFHVKYLGEDRTFNSIEVTAMLLGKLKEIVEKDAGATGVDAVISVPVYYIDSQYRSLYLAAKIAGINVLRLISTPTAAAIEYGLYKDHLPKKDEKPINVVFVDVGHTDTSVSVVAITETKVKVLSSAFDRHLGGRDFEEALFNHFADNILANKNLDIRSNPKAIKRLFDASERIKKTLSANSISKNHVECIMNDTDVSLEMDREGLEKLVSTVLHRFEIPVKKALEDSKISINDISSVEVIGGSTYMPSIRNILSTIFNKQVMSTTNVMECVARGCAIQGAMLSPSTRLAKEFQVEEVVINPVDIAHDGESSKKISVFKRGEDLNQVFKMTFKKNDDFELSALYANADLLPSNTPQCFSKYLIKGVPKSEEKTPVKTRIKYDLFGRFHVEEAWWEEKVEYEEEKKVELTDEEMKDIDQSEGEKEAPAEGEKKEKKFKTIKEVKTRIEKHKLNVVEIVNQPSKELVAKYTKAQSEMAQKDYIVASTSEAKNNLESYSYDLMDKVYEGGELYEFLDPNVRSSFSNQLQDAIDWIYGDGEHEKKEAYDKRLDALKSIGGPAMRRAYEAETRPNAIKYLYSAIESARQFAGNTNEEFSHIDASDREKIIVRAAEDEAWLNQEIQEQNKLEAYKDPVITADGLKEKANSLTNFAKSIMSKPKPKPAPKPEETQPQQSQSGEQAKTTEEQVPEPMDTTESV